MEKVPKNGFTLLEMLITTLIVAIVATIGVPAMSDMVKNNRLTSAVNDLIASTILARSEAMKRRNPVTICNSADPLATNPACDTGASASWENGWVVFADEDGDATIDSGEEILLRQASLNDSLSIGAGSDVSKYLSFSGRGLTRDASGDSVTGSLVFCDDRGITASGTVSVARAVNIARTGRPETLRLQAKITALSIDCP